MRLDEREALLHIRHDSLQPLSEISMHGQSHYGDAESGRRSDQGLAYAACDTIRLPRLHVEDAESTDHAADRTKQSEQGCHRDDDTQGIQMMAQMRKLDPGLHLEI